MVARGIEMMKMGLEFNEIFFGQVNTASAFSSPTTSTVRIGRMSRHQPPLLPCALAGGGHGSSLPVLLVLMLAKKLKSLAGTVSSFEML